MSREADGVEQQWKCDPAADDSMSEDATRRPVHQRFGRWSKANRPGGQKQQLRRQASTFEYR